MHLWGPGPSTRLSSQVICFAIDALVQKGKWFIP
jgi:hypothetical protein